MPRYLVQASYSTAGVSGLVQNPQDRSEAIRPLVERMGGKLEGFYYAFGDYDIVAIVQAPDNVTVAALAMAIGAGGALSSYKTTALLDMNEAVEAMKKAGSVGYRPPSG